jgi:ubiquinone/menaquinone biosynthesis C-methylase UbiE
MTAIAKSEARSWRSFDRVARIYEGAERALFGQRLQAARTAGLDDLASPRRALLLGEGDGRFAAALLARFPNCEVHILDGSAQMLELARQRTQAHARVKTIHADAREYEFSGQYDLVTTLFSSIASGRRINRGCSNASVRCSAQTRFGCTPTSIPGPAAFAAWDTNCCFGFCTAASAC